MKFYLTALAIVWSAACVQSEEASSQQHQRHGALRNKPQEPTTTTAAGARTASKHQGLDNAFLPNPKEVLLDKIFPHRDLNAWPCDVPVATMPVEQIQADLSDLFAFKKVLNPGLVPEYTSIIENKIPMAEYDVQFMKVCGSCESEQLNGYGCQEDDYGYSTQHSALVILPVKINSDEEGSASIINSETLDTFFFHKVVTASKPDTSLVVYEIGYEFAEYAVIASAYGYVSIIPEATGYGSSSELVPSPFDRKAHVTGTMPIYSKVKGFVEMSSGGMTTLSDKATYFGTSGGGFAAVVSADSFKDYGIMPEKVLAGAAPLKQRSWTPMGFIRSQEAGILGPFDALNVALVALAFSDTRPGGFFHSNSTQTLLKSSRIDKLLEMLTDPSAPPVFPDDGAAYFGTFVGNYPENFVPDNQYISENVLNFFKTALENGDDDPCMNPSLDLESLEMDLICADLANNDASDIFLDADYPIELCHSNADVLVVFENVPDESFLKYPLDGISHDDSVANCNVKMFEGTELKKATIRSTQSPTIRSTQAPTASTTVPTPASAPKSSKAPKSPKVSTPKSVKSTKSPKGSTKVTKGPKSAKA